MTYELITAFIAFALVTSLTPGPNNLMLMASGTNFGFRRTMPHMFGVGIGFTIMVLLVGMGLMQVFDVVPYSYLTLKILSIVYLLYLAWKIATAAPLNNDPQNQSNGKPFSFIQAALFQWVNPKAWAMALTAISAYTPVNQPIYSVILIALIFGMINIPSVGTWVVIGTQLRRFLNDPIRLKLFNLIAALLLVASLYPILFDVNL